MEDLTKPLLQPKAQVTGYANAGLVSKTFFNWLNPLLHEGAHKTIEREDVPLLAPDHRAPKLYKRFNVHWPSKREPNAVGRTLWMTFRAPLLGCAWLAFCRLSVLFTGPILIQSFVAITSSGNEQTYPYKRFALVAILVIGKLVEVFSSHQYNFACQKLGMQVRSTLVTTVFHKGLCLSSSGRQRHGVGQIVNYMSADVQSIADVIIYLNYLWVVPLQAVIGGCILFPVVGVSAVAGFLVMIVTVWLEYVAARWLQILQQIIMDGRDSRMKATIEALTSMKIQAWDGKFFKQVLLARDLEFVALSKFTYTVAFSIFISWLAPLTACVAIFSCSVLFGRGLSGSSAFTTIATVRVLQELLRLFPNTLLSISQALISLERLEQFLWSDELEAANSIVNLPQGSENAIEIEDGAFKWDEQSDRTNLQGINLKIKTGSLVAIAGKVGSGKTSILAALQGELPKVAGMVGDHLLSFFNSRRGQLLGRLNDDQMRICGRTACVNQSAWIQNATIQDNILFGLPMNKERYQLALKTSALLPDLMQLEFMDQTEIGERGVNLSGGQKQRIQLARAVYHDSDIYFLDDIFSAVDAHTASEIFRDCVMGALKGKTVLLVTHQIEFLPRADLILVMRDGRVVQSGKYEDLLSAGTDFEALVDAHTEAMVKVAGREDKARAGSQTLEVDFAHLTRSSSESWQIEESIDLQAGAAHQGFVNSMEHDADEGDQVLPVVEKSGRLVEEELKENGHVCWSVYWLYFTKAYGGTLVIALLLVQTIWQILQIAGDYWVADATSYSDHEDLQAERFISIYSALALSCGLCVIMRSMLVGVLGLTTAQSFFLGMFRSIFRAPMSFFDCTPCGRILSRATTDQAAIDYAIPIMFGAVLAVVFQILGMLVVTCRVSWPVVMAIIPLGLIFRQYQAYYFATSRELTRMDGTTRAPVIHHFAETVAGVSTIRCCQQQERFIDVNVDRIDSNIRMDFHNSAAMEWVGLRVELLGVVVLSVSILLLLFFPSRIVGPELVALALTYGLALNQYMFDLVGLSCTLENKMISVERIGQFTDLPSEEKHPIPETLPPSNWPSAGSISLQNVKSLCGRVSQLRYRQRTPLVLKGITVMIEGGQKVGVVGRTGSGKSTLIYALFRLVEPVEGRIFIDNINICNLGLNDLRSKLSIIPQDPNLFDGTIRSNLDPLGEHADHEIWRALEKCQLSTNVKQLEGKLDAPVFTNGDNWSLGQRQLFCLGRVLLRRTRILVLDEATASVDTQTEAIIRKTVRNEFAHCTVISVAHRIPSVMDSDKVLVLDAGNLREFDSPSFLLEQPNSMFSALVREYSNRAVL